MGPFDILMTPIGIALVFMGVFAGLIFVLIRKGKPAREVMYLRERDRRGERLSIEEETAPSLSCKKRKGASLKFFKYGGSYVFSEGGKMVTRFFGKEGTAYTYKFQGAEGNGEEVTAVKIGSGSLEDALIHVWGEDFYKEVPDAQKKLVENSKVYVTVDLESGLTPEGYTPISEEDINEEQDREAAKIFSKGLGATSKQQLYQGMLWAALGGLLIFVLYNVGVFK